MKNITNKPSFENRQTTGLIIVLFYLICGLTAVNGQEIKTYTHLSSDTRQKANRYIDQVRLDEKLLAACIIYQTNKVRREYAADPCISEKILKAAATNHSIEMARLNYFSHDSPITKNRDLEDRLKHAGAFLPGTTFGENLGVDFILALSKVPYYTEQHRNKTYYYDYETKAKINPQTYLQFADNMVKHWMDSKGHRKNLLNKKFSKIGIGIAIGKYKGHDALYVTQNFQGILEDPDAGEAIKRQRIQSKK